MKKERIIKKNPRRVLFCKLNQNKVETDEYVATRDNKSSFDGNNNKLVVSNRKGNAAKGIV